MDARPKIKIEFTPADKVVEIAGWLTLIVLWATTLLNYSKLPETIPSHFNGAGQADNYGNKSTIIVLPVIAAILFLGLTLLNRYPYIFNYPVNITTENAERQYINATRMIRYLKLSIALIFLLIVFGTLNAATGKSEGPGAWFLPAILALMFCQRLFL